MNTEVNRAFDFSSDALLFKKRLLKRLQEEKAKMGTVELMDDDLEYVNAAGIPTPVNDDESENDFPPIPL